MVIYVTSKVSLLDYLVHSLRIAIIMEGIGFGLCSKLCVCVCVALYDDRMVRSHVRRTRDLISTALIHSSLSTALAVEYEAKQAGSAGGSRLSVDCIRLSCLHVLPCLCISGRGIHARC